MKHLSDEVDFKEVVAEPVVQPAQPSKPPVEDRNKRNDRRDRDAAYQRPERNQQRPVVEKEPVNESVESVAIEDVVEKLNFDLTINSKLWTRV